MTLDLDQLLEQAREAKARVGGMQWYSATRFTHERLYNEEANFIAACDPSTIAQLIERVKEAERESADRHRAALEWQRVADDWHDNNAKNLARLRAAEEVVRVAKMITDPHSLSSFKVALHEALQRYNEAVGRVKE